jgi:hypothetical protein
MNVEHVPNGKLWVFHIYLAELHHLGMIPHPRGSHDQIHPDIQPLSKFIYMPDVLW